MAAQIFLEGLFTLPHYGELRQKQLVRLLDLISKVSLTLEQSGSILASLDSRIWDGVSLQRLKSSLADQTVEASDQVEIVGKKQQNYTAIFRYLTQEWWLLVEKADSLESREKALEMVCELAGKLGLRSGTEETYAFLFVLAFTMHPTCVVYDHEKQNLLQQWKPIIKRHLKKCPPLTDCLSILPDNPDDCPAIYFRAAFPDGWTAALPQFKSLADVVQLARTWPLRSSHVTVTARKHAEPPRDMSHMSASAMGVAAAVARQTTIALSQQLLQETQEVPGFKLLKDNLRNVQPQKTMSVLLDTPAEAPASSSKTGVAPALDPQSMIDSLREDLKEEKKEEEKSGKNSTGKKRKKKEKAMKRPCAVAKVLKRPAMSSSKDVLDPDPKRAALLSRIPEDLRKKIESGCSTCRYRKFCTVSCWKRRGYT